MIFLSCALLPLTFPSSLHVKQQQNLLDFVVQRQPTPCLSHLKRRNYGGQLHKHPLHATNLQAQQQQQSTQTQVQKVHVEGTWPHPQGAWISEAYE